MALDLDPPLPTTGSHLIFHLVIALDRKVVHATLTVWHDPKDFRRWHAHVDSWRTGAQVRDLRALPISVTHVSADADSRGVFACVIGIASDRSPTAARALDLALERARTGEWIGYGDEASARHPVRAQMLTIPGHWADPHAMAAVTVIVRAAPEPKYRTMPELPEGRTIIHDDRPLMPGQVGRNAEYALNGTPYAPESARNLIDFCRSRGGKFGSWLPFSRLEYDEFLRSRGIKPSDPSNPFAGLMGQTYSVAEGYKASLALLVDLGGGTIGITDAFELALERSTSKQPART